jgi:aspartate/methionine/tyrosine aminotransferase
MVLNYPHHLTTAMASLSFFEETVKFYQQYNLVLVHDFPYVDIVFDEIKLPFSILQTDPNKYSSIEFFIFSKLSNMNGFRIGFAIGNAEIVTALRKIKAIIDFNQYRGILKGEIAAIEDSQEILKQTVAEFPKRRGVLIKALNNIN